MIAAIAELLAILTDVIFNFRTFWPIGPVKAVNSTPLHQVILNPVEHHIGHFTVANALVAVITIFIVLMQVNVIQTGAAVEHAVINDKAFEMENAERFPGIDRNAINRDVDTGVFLSHAAVPVGIGV